MLKTVAWVVVALLGAGALGAIAFQRGESLSAIWFILAAVCVYLVAYRFYSAFVAVKLLALNDTRATPAERHDDGHDFVPTNKWVLFGHHFAAIAGPGPLIGPTLAAQFGYLPGTLWLIAGAALGGCVQDFVILFSSIRRDGKTLGQMVREEVSDRAGWIAQLAVLAIMVMLLAAVAFIVVNALKSSPWATFTLAMTIPIAMLLGVYLRYLRPGRVIEASAIGVSLILFVVVAGQWVADSAAWAPVFTLGATALAVAIIIYSFAASALPVWLLLAPRDYLSTFVKLGTIGLLGIGIVALHPTLHMPALTQFVDGTGPIFAGKVFPFAFITIACGAISGFHALISSGTTPKLIARETQTRMVGYGAMMCESAVAVMAIIAACSLQPGVYFAINSPAGIVGQTATAATATISAWGFPVTAADMQALAQSVGEQTLFNRTGGAPAFAVGMARIFSQSLGGETVMAIWYHFAVMFEALFILTVLDAGTRVARFMIQDALGHVYKPLGRTSWYPSILGTSALIVAAWGYFLWQGVKDPLGGINLLWPLFGIANQLLATVSLCVATTIIIKMHRARYAAVTLAPLAWLVAVTFTAAWQKAFDANPRVGFLAQARALAAGPATSATGRLIFNNRLDAAVTIILVGMVALVLIESARQWIGVVRGTREVTVKETPFVMTRLAEERG